MKNYYRNYYGVSFPKFYGMKRLQQNIIKCFDDFIQEKKKLKTTELTKT